MFFIDELKDARLYRKKFLLPIDEKNHINLFWEIQCSSIDIIIHIS